MLTASLFCLLTLDAAADTDIRVEQDLPYLGEGRAEKLDLYLPAKVNPELVSSARPDGPQLTFLRSLVAQHAELTGSARSAGLLADWKEHAHKFWRIAPKAEVAKIEGSHEGSAKQAKA